MNFNRYSEFSVSFQETFLSSLLCRPLSLLQIAEPQQQWLQHYRTRRTTQWRQDSAVLPLYNTSSPFSAPTNSTNHTPTASFAQVVSPKNEHEHCRIKSNIKLSTLWIPLVTLDHTREDILYHHLLSCVCAAAFFHVEVGPDAAVQHHSAKALHLKGAQQYGGH